MAEAHEPFAQFGQFLEILAQFGLCHDDREEVVAAQRSAIAKRNDAAFEVVADLHEVRQLQHRGVALDRVHGAVNDFEPLTQQLHPAGRRGSEVRCAQGVVHDLDLLFGRLQEIVEGFGIDV